MDHLFSKTIILIIIIVSTKYIEDMCNLPSATWTQNNADTFEKKKLTQQIILH